MVDSDPAKCSPGSHGSLCLVQQVSCYSCGVQLVEGRCG